ncbi:YgeY family selenium metabolism-linked hydrolase [bacterium]|nr:YgeY family selenium metabolism-linked hydrolase [bacterium]
MSINFNELIQFTQSLVRVQTLSGEEEPAVALAAAEMRRLGFDEIFTDANGSLIGIVNGARTGPTLLLDAHCDTVGVAPGVPWTHDPFGAEIVDGRMVGRGTSDMKGALAAMIHAAGTVDRRRLAGRVAVSATVMEEVMEGVSLATVMEIVRPDFVVIGEATDLNLNHGGRGRAEIHIETIGKPAHSSSPQLGVSAVELMIDVMAEIKQLALPTDPLAGQALMVLTDIISDPYPGYSVIPSRCRATYDRRLLPGEEMQNVVAAIEALPALRFGTVQIAQGEHVTYTGATLAAPKFFPAWKFEVGHQLIQSAMAGLHRAGLSPKLSAYQFCTNGAHSAGNAGVPTIGFGPSTEGHAHIVDEYIELEDLRAAARGYVGIVEAILG